MDDTLLYEEIDRIVDKVIENPRKAAKLKEALHDAGSHARPQIRQATRKRSSYDESVDDLWDNVPV